MDFSSLVASIAASPPSSKFKNRQAGCPASPLRFVCHLQLAGKRFSMYLKPNTVTTTSVDVSHFLHSC